jgi:hypothetical protein
VQIRKYFSANESPSDFASGAPVWHWSAKLNEFGRDDPRPSSLYLAEISSWYLLLSNDLEELKQLATGLASDRNLQTLDALQDWNSVKDRQFWGYRRYRHAGVANPVAAGMTEVTPNAEALTFFVDFDKKVGVLRLFSSATDEGAAAKINARAVLPRFSRVGPGVWETRSPLAGDDDSAERMFVVMNLFGFGIYL